jgi:deoxyribodipyrimidine photolyase
MIAVTLPSIFSHNFMQSKVKDLESQLSKALKSDMTRSRDPLEPQPRAAENTLDSSAVTKKLEEELKKRDALIERLHEENEKLFDRLTEKSVASSTQVILFSILHCT